MKTNVYGQSILSSDNLVDLLMQGKNISHLSVLKTSDIILYEKYQTELLDKVTVFIDEQPETLTFDDFHFKTADEWVFPLEYQRINVLSFLLAKCKTKEEIDRVHEEYILFEERDLIMLLRLFIFLVDFMREHKFLWGVGRGSSVSSFCLYLIGIHRVNSLHYQFDIRDYLK